MEKFENIKRELNKFINNGGIFGFELKNINTNEWEYEDIQINWSEGTFSAFGATICLDDEMSLDANLEALFELIYESGEWD